MACWIVDGAGVVALGRHADRAVAALALGQRGPERPAVGLVVREGHDREPRDSGGGCPAALRWSSTSIEASAVRAANTQ